MATLVSRKYSILCFTYTDGSKVFEATFALGCLTPNHIQVYIEDDLDGLGEQNYLEFTYDSVTETVTVTSDITIPSGETEVTVVVQRTVPKDELYISFGNGADVTRSNIDGMITYTLMALHEVLDGRWDVSFDWEALNASYTSVYNLLLGGTTSQVLTKGSDADLDFGWASASAIPLTDLHTSVGTTVVADEAWTGHIVTLGDSITDVTLNTGTWSNDAEFVIRAKNTVTVTLGSGVTFAHYSGDATSVVVTPAPSGMMMRKVGSTNAWLFLGNGSFL